jgi:hypothetical protein
MFSTFSINTNIVSSTADKFGLFLDFVINNSFAAIISTSS